VDHVGPERTDGLESSLSRVCFRVFFLLSELNRSDATADHRTDAVLVLDTVSYLLAGRAIRGNQLSDNKTPEAERMSRRVVGNAASLVSMQVASYVLPLITVPYLLRVLGPERFGLIAFSQAVMTYFVTLNDYGFNLSATRELAICRADRRLKSELYFSVMAIKAALCLISLLSLCGIVHYVPRFHVNSAVFYASFLIVVGNMLFPAWFFQGIEKLYWISVVNMAAGLAFTATIFLVVRTSSDYVLAAFIQSGGRLAAGILGVIIIFWSEDLEVRCPTFAQMRQKLVDGWHLFLLQISVSLFISSITVVLGLVRSMTEVGYFSAANKILNAGQAVMSGIGQAMYPHVCSLASRSRAGAIIYLRKAMLAIGSISMVGGVLVFVFAVPIVRIVMGPDYLPAVAVLRFMSTIPFICAINNIYGTQAMLNFGMRREFTRTVISSGFLCILVLAPLAFWFGACGAAASALLFELLQTAILGAILYRRGVQLLPVVRLVN
jgi:PST family polysaccharide transporter